MSGLGTLGLIGVLCFSVAFIIWAALRASSQAGAAEEEVEAAKRQVDAIRREAQTDRETLGRMADADAASVHDTAAAARERMRSRDPRKR